ncbi:MAG TPA: calcium-binding protein, partial [Allosphingosinicella sp.]|nr:calcium-binding protein [Allosphingosinicella sp.]
MVKLKAGTGPVDVKDEYLYFLSLNGPASSITSSTALFEGGYTNCDVKLTGTDFADTDGDSVPDVGTVQSLEVLRDGAVVFTISGIGMAYADFGYGMAFSDSFWFLLSGSDELQGSTEADEMSGRDGNDLIHGNDGDDFLSGGAADDQLFGDGGADRLVGEGGFDQLYGGDGDDFVGEIDWVLTGSFLADGGAGLDLWSGDLSASSASLNISMDVAATAAGLSFGTNRTARGVEAAMLRLGSGDDTFRDYALGGDDYVELRAGDDTAYVSAGRDSLNAGGAGDTDRLFVDYSGATAGVNSFLGGLGDYYVWEGVNRFTATRSVVAVDFDEVTVTATAFADQLVGSAGNDRLLGGGGDDILTPQLGSDFVDGGEGSDTLAFRFTPFVRGYMYIDYPPALKAGVKIDLTLTTSQLLPNYGGGEFGLDILPLGSVTVQSIENIEGTALGDQLLGNSLANKLTGLGGDDLLNGRDGNDVLEGGNGSDIILGGAGNDSLNGGGGDGIDTVSYASAAAAVTVNLGSTGAQNTGGGGIDTVRGFENAVGSDHADSLTGNGGSNRLDGGRSADKMTGGNGNDTYVVDNAGDQAVETSAAGGIDTVLSSVGFTLGAYVENLTLTGTGATRGTGNALANKIAGNRAANTLDGGEGDDLLDGGAGGDTMNGGAGNDTYFADNIADKAVETAGNGTDTVLSSVSFALGANVENLTLTGTAAIQGTGNGLANSLTGNGAANRLNGGAGADTMTGGAGNDTYVVDDAGDQIVEAAGGGTDTVQSAITLTLADTLENLTLIGAAVTGNGNAGANTLLGNARGNRLSGLGGNDLIKGLDGNDTLRGGTGD